MYPIIAGLGLLTGEGNLGYFVKLVNKKEQKNNWYYTNGKCGAGKGVTLTVPNPYKIKNKNTKIAVLIGPRTSSSGEMTTISFIGKKTARLFGASSGGYTTASGSLKYLMALPFSLQAVTLLTEMEISFCKKSVPTSLLERARMDLMQI